MLYIVTCVDKPNSLDKRLANRPAHLEYLKGLGATVKAGGAMLSDDEQAPIGSMLIFEGVSAADIRKLLADDPYAKAGLFETVAVRPWRQAVGPMLA